VKDLVDVITFPEGLNDRLIWKSPITDFNTGTVVIVAESQVAVFYMNGQCSEELQPGRHVLETCELPFFKKVFTDVTKDGKKAFSAQLYFINKVEFARLKWGKGGIHYEDIEGASFDIGVRGLYNIQVDNSRKLIEKINGVEPSCDKNAIEERFRELVASAVDNSFVNIMADNNISILEVQRHRVEVAKAVLPEIEDLFLEYGIKVTQFIIEHILLPEDNPYLKELRRLAYEEANQIRRLRLEGQKNQAMAEIEANKMDILSEATVRKRSREGYTYQSERQFDVLQDSANNTSGGGVVGQFTQLGVGLGAAGAVSKVTQDVLNNNPNASLFNQVTNNQDMKNANNQNANSTQDKETIVCQSCKAILPQDAKFCFECGAKVVKKGMVICPNCNKMVNEAKFCSECGTKLIPDKKVCKSCGHELSDNAKFCPECGTVVEEGK